MKTNTRQLGILLVLSIAPGLFCAAGIKEFTLIAKENAYIGVGGEIEGQANPVLRISKGDQVRITILQDDTEEHDIALDSHDRDGKPVESKVLKKKGETAAIEFTAVTNDYYYCTTSGHRLDGMEGRIDVDGQSDGGEDSSLLEKLGVKNLKLWD